MQILLVNRKSGLKIVLLLFILLCFGGLSFVVVKYRDSIFNTFDDTISFFAFSIPKKNKLVIQNKVSNITATEILDKIPPEINVTKEFSVTSSSIELDLTTNEGLIEGEFDNYKVERRLMDDCRSIYFCYKLTVSNLVLGENSRALDFSDVSGNSSEVNLSINRIQVLPAVQASEYVEKIVPDGNILSVLIDKEYGLPSDYNPSDLVYLNSYGIPGISGSFMMRQVVIDDLLKMQNDIKAQGYNLTVLSAYRSYAQQIDTYNYWVGAVGYTEANRASARPGHSEHQLGTTLDLTTTDVNNRLSEQFGSTLVGVWLAQNSYKYGFVLSYPQGKENITGYKYEPWHFRYVGIDTATAIKNSGLTSREFLKTIN